MKFIKNIFFSVIFLTSFSSFSLCGEILEGDIVLNEHIVNFTPIYCTQKKIPLTYWKSKFEFMVELVHAEKLKPTPPSDIKNTFLGYKNPDTKIKVFCNRIDPVSGRVLGTYDLGIFQVQELNKVISFKLPDVGVSGAMNVFLSIKRDMLNIKVKDSGKFMGMFKSYTPSRVFNVDFQISPQSKG